MKTRDRILECALALFNQEGEPNVSTLEIANELGISPGNLYYHFHGKEPLVLELFERFQAEMAPLLNPPAEAQLEAEDYWLFLHLIVERLALFRFLFQDLSNLAGRLPKLARGIRAWLNTLKRTLASLLASLKAQGLL
ncbi:MAG: TetR family transcriptional regulator, partial [Pseudomonas sp. PGPPP3]